jgi:vacuolar-type H+-ATPase subunit E/Vma4
MSLEPLIMEIENLKSEYEKFERGNKSAGTRARKILQNIKKQAQDIRTQIQDSKKTE